MQALQMLASQTIVNNDDGPTIAQHNNNNNTNTNTHSCIHMHRHTHAHTLQITTKLKSFNAGQSTFVKQWRR